MAIRFHASGGDIAVVAATAARGRRSGAGGDQICGPSLHDEGKAQKHCPKDAVVYSTGHNGVYFLKGDPQYGHLKNAWYVCRREADHGGWHLQAH